METTIIQGRVNHILLIHSDSLKLRKNNNNHGMSSEPLYTDILLTSYCTLVKGHLLKFIFMMEKNYTPYWKDITHLF